MPAPMSALDAAPSLLLRLSSLRPCRASAAGPSREPPREEASRESRSSISSGRRDQTRSDDEGGASRTVSSSATPSPPAQRHQKHRPRLRALVVVEGPSDARAVLRAVDLSPGCHSLDGATWARNKGAMDELAEAAGRALGGGGEEGGGAGAAAVVLLLDPDAPGRVARGEGSRELCRRLAPGRRAPPLALYHAFIPPHRCRAARAVGGKSAGDVGIEHASASAVVAALRAARRHRGEERGNAASSSSESSPPDSAPSPLPFSMRELEEARLATSFDAGSQQQKQRQKLPEKESEEGASADAAAAAASPPSPSSPSSSQKTSDRRRRFCNALGLGPCTGAQLLRALNEWGLTREDWEVGMKAAEEEEEG